LKLVDYAAWDALQQMVYQRQRFTTINQLMQAIVIEWFKLSQDTDISQGSVATQLRCGGIFSDTIITNFLLILTVKEFRKSRLIFDKVKVFNKNYAILGHPVYCTNY